MNVRFELARFAMSAFPLQRGRALLARKILGDKGWPERADILFRYGKFVDASLRPWPYGFRELWCRGIMEDAETELWQRLLRPCDIVIDAGANWGYWSLVAAQAVGQCGKVVAIEAVPTTAQSLEKNLMASGAGNVIVVRAAVGSAQGSVRIYSFLDDPFSGRSSVGVQEGLIVDTEFEVPVRTISDVVEELRCTPTLLKLDVEGSEWPALKGYESGLRSENPPFLSIEYNEATASTMGYHPRDMIKWLSSVGYQTYLPVRGKLCPVEKPMGIEEWSPMMWAFRPDVHRKRLRESGFRLE